MTFLRPDSNVTQTGYTGGFADIDEAAADDADFAYGTPNASTPTLEVHVSDPARPPGGITGVVRWRSAKRSEGGAIGSGNAITGTCTLLQGSTVISSDSYSPAGWASREFTFTLSSVSNFSDLRLRFTQTASGGNNTSQRCGLAVSWAEVDIPDPRRVVVIT